MDLTFNLILDGLSHFLPSTLQSGILYNLSSPVVRRPSYVCSGKQGKTGEEHFPEVHLGVTFTRRVLRMDSDIFRCVFKNTVLDLSTVPGSKVKSRIPELLCSVLGMPH